MILEIPYTKGLYDENGIDYRYYGLDAINFLIDMNWESDIQYLGKECDEGIIIGIEDSNSHCDYYYIVYDPKTDKAKYILANDTKFVNTIKCG